MDTEGEGERDFEDFSVYHTSVHAETGVGLRVDDKEPDKWVLF